MGGVEGGPCECPGEAGEDLRSGNQALSLLEMRWAGPAAVAPASLGAVDSGALAGPLGPVSELRF